MIVSEAYIRTDGHGRWQLWVEDLNTGAMLTKTLHHVKLGSELKPGWMVEDSGGSSSPLAPFTPPVFPAHGSLASRDCPNRRRKSPKGLTWRHLDDFGRGVWPPTGPGRAGSPSPACLVMVIGRDPRLHATVGDPARPSAQGHHRPR